MKTSEDAMKVFAGVGLFAIVALTLPVLSILFIAWKAWWLYPAWAWFIEPLGVQTISFWHFAALLFMIQVATHQGQTKKDDRREDWGALVSLTIVWPVIAWVVLWWMK